MDSLVVSLTLDASTFTAEQRRAVDALRNLEQQAGRAAKGAQDSLGASAVSFFRMVEQPASALRRQFESWATHAAAPQRALRDISNTARQTGEEVERGAGRGASALMAFGVAGVAAFAAYEALSKTINAVNRQASGVFGTGLSAYLGGAGIQQFSAIAKALNVLGNVPEAQSENFLSNLGSMRARYTRDPGAFAAMQSAFAQAGVGGSALFAPYSEHYLADILTQLHNDLDRMSPERRQEAISNLSDIIPGNILNALADPTLFAELQKQLQHAPTAEQQQKFIDLIKSENELSQAVGSLERNILVYLVPPLTRLAQALDAVIGGAPGASVLSSGINPATGQSGMMGWVQRNMPASIYNWLSSFPALAPKAGGNTTGSGGLNTTGSGAVGSNQYPGQGNEFLKNQRGRMANEIATTPGLRDEVLAMASLEDARDPAGPIESLFNRAAYTGKNISELLHGRFYSTRDRFPGAIAGFSTNPALRARMQSGLDVVIAGSNRLKGATDQGQGGDPNAPGSPGGTTSGLIFPPGATPGAIYNDFGGGPGGHAGAAQWRIDQQSHTAGTASVASTYAGRGAGVPPWIKRNSKGEPISDEVAAGAATANIPESVWHSFLVNNANPGLRAAQAANAGGVTNNSGGNTSVNGTSITINAPTREGSDIAYHVGDALSQAARAANANNASQ